MNKKSDDQRKVAGAAGLAGFVAGAATVATGVALSNKKTRDKISQKAQKLNTKKNELAKKLNAPDKKSLKAKTGISKNPGAGN